MFKRRLSWAQLTRTGTGVPVLFVLRPRSGGGTPANMGDEYPLGDTADKRVMLRCRQMYEQKRIGTREELDLTLAKLPAAKLPLGAKKKGKKNG